MMGKDESDVNLMMIAIVLFKITYAKIMVLTTLIFFS